MAKGEGWTGSDPGERDAHGHGSGAGESVCTSNFVEGLFHGSGNLVLPADGHSDSHPLQELQHEFVTNDTN